MIKNIEFLISGEQFNSSLKLMQDYNSFCEIQVRILPKVNYSVNSKIKFQYLRKKIIHCTKILSTLIHH